MYRQSTTLIRAALALGVLLFSLGATPAAAAPTLRAPWTCGEAYQVSQSHDTGSHVGKGTYSWDFAMPVGTPLVSPADGEVRKVRQDSTRYGCDSSYAYDANYVIVAFDDGTEALFLHLEANSVPVQEGDRLRAGDSIGKVGMSGWTCGPHLHFQIQKTCDSWWCDSVPAQFDTWGAPSTGQELTSQNCSDGSDEPQRASRELESKAPGSNASAGRATGGGEGGHFGAEENVCSLDHGHSNRH